MDIKKLLSINAKLDNITRTALPYWWGTRKKIKGFGKDSEKKMVVYFGNDLMSTTGFSVAQKDLYFQKCNNCLDYIRKNFGGCDLYYKPHPVDPGESENETGFLNLDGFNLINQKITSELFLWNNFSQIKATFSTGSLSSFGAYSMGLNSYVFYRCYSDVYPKQLVAGFNDIFSKMPESFFVNMLDQKPIANERVLEKDESFESNLKRILSEKEGKVWFICSFSGSIVILAILSELVKIIAPGRPVGLIINRGRRWDVIGEEYYKDYFDEIVYFPRVGYSLRPWRLWLAIKIARQIKNFRIAGSDVLIVASYPEFVENCFISYHDKNFKVGFISDRDFNGQYNSHSLTYAQNDDFRFNKATWFYNNVFEPLLGLNRTVYMAYSQRDDCYTNRYLRPINEIFDRLFIMDIPK